MSSNLFLIISFLASGLAKADAQMNNSSPDINWGQSKCGVQLAITTETNIVTLGESFIINEHIKNSSTNSIVLRSVEQYLVNNSGKKYKLSGVPDMSTESGSNINAPYAVESGRIDEIPYAVKINANIEPDDFTIQVIEHVTTSTNQVCEILSNPIKLKVRKSNDSSE